MWRPPSLLPGETSIWTEPWMLLLYLKTNHTGSTETCGRAGGWTGRTVSAESGGAERKRSSRPISTTTARWTCFWREPETTAAGFCGTMAETVSMGRVRPRPSATRAVAWKRSPLGRSISITTVSSIWPSPVPRTRNGAGLRLIRNLGNGRFEEPASLLPGLPSTVEDLETGDLDDDGDVDLALLSGGRVLVLRNDGGNANGWLNVQLAAALEGSGKNNFYGIGSTIEVNAEAHYQSVLVRRSHHPYRSGETGSGRRGPCHMEQRGPAEPD